MRKVRSMHPESSFHCHVGFFGKNSAVKKCQTDAQLCFELQLNNLGMG